MNTAAPPKLRLLRRIVLRYVLPAVFVLVIFTYVLPQVADYGEVWDAMTSMTWVHLVVLLLCAVANIATFGPTWMAALPGLSYVQAMELSMSTTALANVVPAGGALSMAAQFQMLRAWGYQRRAVTLAVVVTGIWNTFFSLGIPAVALVLLSLQGGRNLALQQAAVVGGFALIVGLVLFALVLRSEEQARRIGHLWDRVGTVLLRLVRRGPVRGAGEGVVRFRRDSLDYLRARWLRITLAQTIGLSTVFFVLLAAVRAVDIPGSEVTVTEALAAWSLVKLLTAVPIAPGGLGIQELGLTGALTGFGGSEAKVVAAVLLYRIVTYIPIVVLGGVAAFTWRRHHPDLAGAVLAHGPGLGLSDLDEPGDQDVSHGPGSEPPGPGSPGPGGPGGVPAPGGL